MTPIIINFHTAKLTAEISNRHFKIDKTAALKVVMVKMIFDLRSVIIESIIAKLATAVHSVVDEMQDYI